MKLSSGREVEPMVSIADALVLGVLYLAQIVANVETLLPSTEQPLLEHFYAFVFAATLLLAVLSIVVASTASSQNIALPLLFFLVAFCLIRRFIVRGKKAKPLAS